LKVKKNGRLWTVNVAIAKQLYEYKYPFQINEYFLTWKTIYQFQVKSQIITVTAIDSLKKEFYIQEFLKRFSVSNKKKTQLKQMIIEDLGGIPMKIFKYIVFISILSGIFFVIYRQSDEKGLRKLWISFKKAVLVATIVASLLIQKQSNQVYQERLLSEQEFNSFEDNNGQVLLAKADGNPVTPSTNRGPSNFPTPPSGGRRSRPVYVPKYRVAPKTVDQGLGAGANLAGTRGEGGSSELDENVKERKIEIVYRIKENPALAREAQRAGRDQDAQRSLNNLVEQLALGNQNSGIGTENVFKDVY
jgi:hypothetical protein